jgi:acyl-coenzyme A synthetase/AMP-(fatty) acid ligase
VAARVAPHKRVRAVRFTDAIPRTPAGKIVRRLLREKPAALRDQRAAARDQASYV